MNKEKVQDFINMFDLNIQVTNGGLIGNLHQHEYFTKELDNGKFLLNIPNKYKVWKSNFDTHIMAYAIIDAGFEYQDICSYETFTLLHEIGHIINGDIEEGIVYVTRVANLPKDTYNKHKEYIKIPDEWWAWVWAYEFLLANKDFIKRLEL